MKNLKCNFNKELKIAIVMALMSFTTFITAFGQQRLNVYQTDDYPRIKNVIDSTFNNAPYIFEGEIINVDSRTGSNLFLIKVNKVFRGHEKIKDGTIILESKGSFCGQTRPNYALGSINLFACKKSDDTTSSYLDRDVDHKMRVTHFYNDCPDNWGALYMASAFRKRYTKGFLGVRNYFWSGMNLLFKNDHSFYSFMNDHFQLKPQKPEPLPPELKSVKEKEKSSLPEGTLIGKEKEEHIRKLDSLRHIMDSAIKARKKDSIKKHDE